MEATRPGHWKLLSDLRWDGDDFAYVVPAGFETDLASVPRLLRCVLNRNGASRRPAVLHDALYHAQTVSRARADEIFRQALKAEGVIAPGRFMYWAGVRLGGWLAWNNKS